MTEPVERPGPRPVWYDNSKGERVVVGHVCPVDGVAFIGRGDNNETLAAEHCWCPIHQRMKSKRQGFSGSYCMACQEEEETRRTQERGEWEAKQRANAVPYDATMDGVVDEDRFFATPEEFLEWHDIRVGYCYEAEPFLPGLTAESIVERINHDDDAPEGFEYSPGKEAIEELQSKLNEFFEKHPVPTCWHGGKLLVVTDVEVLEPCSKCNAAPDGCDWCFGHSVVPSEVLQLQADAERVAEESGEDALVAYGVILHSAGWAELADMIPAIIRAGAVVKKATD